MTETADLSTSTLLDAPIAANQQFDLAEVFDQLRSDSIGLERLASALAELSSLRFWSLAKPTAQHATVVALLVDTFGETVSRHTGGPSVRSLLALPICSHMTDDESVKVRGLTQREQRDLHEVEPDERQWRALDPSAYGLVRPTLFVVGGVGLIHWNPEIDPGVAHLGRSAVMTSRTALTTYSLTHPRALASIDGTPAKKHPEQSAAFDLVSHVRARLRPMETDH